MKKRPDHKTATNDAIKLWLKENWRDAWWGLMDCDRCSLRTEGHPCDTCGRWPYLIQDYRNGDILVPMGTKR